jgi:hypothetical protein
MINAPQGPGGGLDLPPQRSGEAPPARFPATANQMVAGHIVDDAPETSSVGAANPQLAKSLLLAGFVILFITGFMPATANGGWGSGSGVGLNAGITVACLGLVSISFSRPKPRLWSLLTLTVLIAFMVVGQIAIVVAIASLSKSLGIGTVVSAAAIITLAVGIVMAWIAQANAET